MSLCGELRSRLGISRLILCEIFSSLTHEFSVLPLLSDDTIQEEEEDDDDDDDEKADCSCFCDAF